MNTKTLATTITFAALTVALNPAVSGIGVPAPYAPYLIYGLWEIPIITAFLLLNPASAIAIAILNSAVLFAIFPGALPTGPVYNLIAVSTTLLGLHIARKIVKNGTPKHKDDLRIVAGSTIIAIFLRVIVMTLVNYTTLQQPYPIGFELPEIEVLATLPFTAIFNATVVLYVIPVGEFIGKVVKSRLKLES